MSEYEATFYGVSGQENLDICVEDVIETLMNDSCNDIEYPIEIIVFRRMKITKNIKEFANRFTENILEQLDDEFGNPDDDWTKPTENMIEAGIKFAKVIESEYKVFMCEPTGEILKYTEEMVKEIV